LTFPDGPGPGRGWRVVVVVIVAVASVDHGGPHAVADPPRHLAEIDNPLGVAAAPWLRYVTVVAARSPASSAASVSGPSAWSCACVRPGASDARAAAVADARRLVLVAGMVGAIAAERGEGRA
jgi:hypothetical protein